MKYEEAVSRCWAEIDVDALLENYRTARGMLAPECELICVMKANAYGVGVRQVAKLLRAEGAKTFAVACVSEAEEVLDEVPDADVLVLGLAGALEAERAIRRGILLTAFSENSAATIAAAAERAGKMARVHGKIETGLHRLGFDPADVNALTALAILHQLQAAGYDLPEDRMADTGSTPAIPSAWCSTPNAIWARCAPARGCTACVPTATSTRSAAAPWSR